MPKKRTANKRKVTRKVTRKPRTTGFSFFGRLPAKRTRKVRKTRTVRAARKNPAGKPHFNVTAGRWQSPGGKFVKAPHGAKRGRKVALMPRLNPKRGTSARKGYRRNWNPQWHLQGRRPRGLPGGGQWTGYTRKPQSPRAMDALTPRKPAGRAGFARANPRRRAGGRVWFDTASGRYRNRYGYVKAPVGARLNPTKRRKATSARRRPRTTALTSYRYTPIKKRRAPTRRRSYRRNPAAVATMSWQEMTWQEQGMTLLKNLGVLGVGYFGANAVSNLAQRSGFMPVSLAEHGGLVGQGLALVAAWVVPKYVEALQPYQAMAVTGAALSLAQGLVARAVTPTSPVWTTIGAPNISTPALGADLDVYEAALRGYPNSGALNEGWADYMPGDEQLLAAIRAQDVKHGMSEYITEPLSRRGMSEYIAEPLSRRGMSEYVAEPLSEYIAEPLGQVRIEEAMAGSTNWQLNRLLNQAGLGQSPAAEGIGQSPYAEQIGRIPDGEAIEAELEDSEEEYDEPAEMGVEVTEAMAGVEIVEAMADDETEDDKLEPLPLQRESYWTKYHQAVPGGGIFGADVVDGTKPRKAPKVDAQTMRRVVADEIRRRGNWNNQTQLCAAVYNATKERLGIASPNSALEQAFLVAFKAELPVASPAAVPIDRPVDGAPMLTKPIQPAGPPPRIREIKDQKAGEVGGIFHHGIFS